MGELEQLRLRPRRAQRLDDPVADAAAAVDGHARWLVDNQQGNVLEGDRKLGRTSPGGRVGGSHWRYSHAVADSQPVVGLHPTAVDAHFAAAQDAIDVAFGYALQLAQQEVIDALRIAFFPDHEPFDLRSGRWLA